MRRYRFVCKLGFGDMFLQVLGWILLTLITFGLALPFFTYYFIKLIINHTEVEEIGA